MKIHFPKSLYLVFSVIAALVINGCSATTGPGSTQTSGSMVATVNGQPWSSTVVPLVSGGSTAIYDTTSGTLTITGVSAALNGTVQTLALILIHPHLGADSLGTGNTGQFSYGTPGQHSYVTAGFGAGTVNLTKYDQTHKLVSGTFSFTAHQIDTLSHVVTVTGGSFVDVGWSVH